MPQPPPGRAARNESDLARLDTSYLQAGGFQPRRIEAFDPDESARETGHSHEIPSAVPRIVEVPRDTATNSGEPFRFAAHHGICTATWGYPIFIEVEIGRFADGRDELRAEVIVRSTVPGLETQLAQRTVPLLGSRAVPDLARYLKDRVKGRVVDFADILETAFVRAVSAHREGEPAIGLDTVPTRVGPRYVLPQLALADLPTFAWAQPGHAKTWLAIGVACALQSGRREVLGIEPAASRRVGFFDWELTEFDVAERARMLSGGDAPAITYVRCRLALWDELDRLTRIVREHRLDYLVIDSADMACGGVPPDSSEAALRFNSALRQLGLGSFVTAHTTKDGAENAPFGSTFWLAQLRLGWFLKRDQTAGSGFTLAAFCKKASTDREPAPLAWSLSFEEGRARFIRTDVRNSPDLSRGGPLRWRIQYVLRSGPRLVTEVAEDLEEKPESVARVLRRYGKTLFTRQAGEDGIDRWANLEKEVG